MAEQDVHSRPEAGAMTEDEKTMARALSKCTFVPGILVKRFARNLAFMAEQAQPKPLTPLQAEFLRSAVVRYRRQIPDDVVALAKGEAP